MLSLPSKPWKKVRVTRAGKTRYAILFLSPLKSEEELREIVEEDLEPCLGPDDRLTDLSWETKEITLITRDFDSFHKRLLFQSITVEKAGF